MLSPVGRRIPRVLRDVSVTAVGSYIAAFSTTVRGLLLAKLLPPSDLGTIATITLVLAFALHADLGVAQAAGRKIGLALGEGNREEVPRLSLYGLAAPLIGGVIVSTGLLAFTLSQGANLHPDVRLGLYTACLIVLVQGMVAAQQVLLKNKREFRKAATLAITTALASLLAGIVGALVAGVEGVLIGQVLASFLAVGIGLSLSPVPPLFLPSRVDWTALIRAGFPLAILLFGAYGLVHVDRIMVLTYEGREALGIYAIVLYVGTALFMIPSAVAGVMGPRLLSRYGRYGTIESIEELTWRPVSALSVVLPVVIFTTWIFAPALIRFYLPAYEESIGPLRIYLMGSYFLGINAGVSDTLVAINRYRRNIPIILSAIVLNILLDIFLLGWMGLGLTGAALGSAITYFCYWLACSCMVRWFFDRRITSCLAFNIGKGWPGFALVAITLTIWQINGLSESFPKVELPLLGLILVVMVRRWRRLKLSAPERNFIS